MGESDNLIESPLIESLKNKGFRAVGKIPDRDFTSGLLLVAAELVKEGYKHIRILPPESVLPQNYTWHEDPCHIVYAKTRVGRVVLGEVNAARKDVLNYQF